MLPAGGKLDSGAAAMTCTTASIISPYPHRRRRRRRHQNPLCVHDTMIASASANPLARGRPDGEVALQVLESIKALSSDRLAIAAPHPIGIRSPAPLRRTPGQAELIFEPGDGAVWGGGGGLVSGQYFS